MCVEVGRVGDIIAGVLQPAHEVQLPLQELARTGPLGIGPIEGNLHSPGSATDGSRSVAIVLIYAFAGCIVVWVVIVGVVSSQALLVKQLRYPVVIALDEDNVVVV